MGIISAIPLNPSDFTYAPGKVQGALYAIIPVQAGNERLLLYSCSLTRPGMPLSGGI